VCVCVCRFHSLFFFYKKILAVGTVNSTASASGVNCIVLPDTISVYVNGIFVGVSNNVIVNNRSIGIANPLQSCGQDNANLIAMAAYKGVAFFRADNKNPHLVLNDVFTSRDPGINMFCDYTDPISSPSCADMHETHYWGVRPKAKGESGRGTAGVNMKFVIAFFKIASRKS
jgi:hypothetical protein